MYRSMVQPVHGGNLGCVYGRPGHDPRFILRNRLSYPLHGRMREPLRTVVVCAIAAAAVSLGARGGAGLPGQNRAARYCRRRS